MSTKQPDALRLADALEQQFPIGTAQNYLDGEAAAELRRQHADLAHAARYAEQLGRELSKAGAENADLRARVQELGQMARDVNSRRVVELEAQLEAIGGVSPPEGMAGWMQGVEAASALLSKKAEDFAQEHGYDDMGGLSFGRGAHADAKLDYHSTLIELADEVRAMLPAPPLASEAKGASHE